MYRDVAPVMRQLEQIAHVCGRARLVNAAMGTHLTPDEIAARYSDETIDLLIAWSTHTKE